MSNEAYDHGQDSLVSKCNSVPDQPSGLKGSGSLSNLNPQKSRHSTTSCVSTEPSGDDTLHRPLDEKPVHTVETSYFSGKGTIIEIKKNGETVQVTRPYGIGIDTLFSMSNNVSYAAKFLTQQVFPEPPIVAGF